MFSPHTRRCFYTHPARTNVDPVFSAYAEVFLDYGSRLKEILCFLRIRGGVSLSTFIMSFITVFSPHTRRCFRHSAVLTHEGVVFSAYAEVFLSLKYSFFSSSGFLRIRGGVSDVRQI